MGTLRSNLQRKNLTLPTRALMKYTGGKTANSYGMCTARFMEILYSTQCTSS